MRVPLDRLLATARRFPHHAAVHDGSPVTYSELLARTRRIAAALPPPTAGAALGALQVGRDATGYAALLATAWSGRAYVPLNSLNPPGRNAAMLLASGADTLVVDGSAGTGVLELTRRLPHPVTVVVLGPGEVADSVLSRHRVVRVDPLAGDQTRSEPAEQPDGLAYLLFTSGTTGVPSGVPVRVESVCAYLDAIAERHDLDPSDRTSQTFDLTFDLSVHDLFATWQAGACLHPLTRRALLNPVAFIRRHELSAWFSVPSAAARAATLGVLGSGVLPSLRWSIFCGEPLGVHLATAWQSASPGATLDNLYGPTEATIAITGFQPAADASYGNDRDERDGGDGGNGVLPIGRPFDGQRAAVMGDDGPAPPGTVGELWLAGSQVADGYWADPGRTADRFVTRPDGRWFRTGDLVRQDPSGCLRYHGRSDDQVKINGFRVELLEVDHAVRAACDSPDALVVPWPDAHSIESLVAAVPRTAGRAPAEIIAACAEQLPAYMVPRRVVVVDEIPRNSNGKLDRKALAALLTKGAPR